jgi:hypothetical protein
MLSEALPEVWYFRFSYIFIAVLEETAGIADWDT